MKSVRKFCFIFCALGLLIAYSCQKENVNENRAPVAYAGVDQIIYLPATSAVLDGSKSLDAENAIVGYEWRQIEGPTSARITDDRSVKTGVLQLELGTYRFELKVVDLGKLSSKDTVQISVYNQTSNPSVSQPCDNNQRPEIAARLVPIGKLSGARANMAVATAGNIIVFAGGHGTGIPETWGSSKVDIYHLSSQTWSTAQLSVARYGIAAIAAENKIFLAGGQSGDGAFNSIYSTVDIYDINKNSWSKQNLGEARGFLTAAAVGSKVFFAGGEKDLNYNNSDRVDIYDLSLDSWTTNNLSKPRSFISALTVGDKIFFAGGHTENRWYGDPAFAIDIYDHATGTWSQSSLRDPMGFIGGAAYEGKAYWADGCNVEVRDLMTGTSSFATLYRPGSWWNANGQNLVVKENKIIFYTDNSFNDDLAELERDYKFDILDLNTNTWSIGVLPYKLSGFSIVSVNNKIYIAGGYVNGLLSDQVWNLEF